MKLELKSLQKQAQMSQAALNETDQRAAKAEASAARLKLDMDELMKVYLESN